MTGMGNYLYVDVLIVFLLIKQSDFIHMKPLTNLAVAGLKAEI
jgi:hypothetical protein